MVYISKILIPRGFRGITLYPFIVLKNKEDKNNSIIINHEKIHLRQQAEMLVVLFYIWYGLEFLIRLLQYKSRQMAYRNISFEREAYQNEKNTTYLKERFFWKFLKYI